MNTTIAVALVLCVAGIVLLSFAADAFVLLKQGVLEVARG